MALFAHLGIPALMFGSTWLMAFLGLAAPAEDRERPPLLDNVIAAEFVRLGKPLDPHRIANLILLSPGSLEGKRQKAGPRSEVPDTAYLLTYIMPRALPEFMLRSGFGDPTKLTDEQIDRWYEMWMREGQRKAQLDRLQQYEAGDIEQVIRELKRPVLLLWGEANTTAEFEQAAEFRHLMGNVESLKFISYPGVGHMAVQEDGATRG